MIISIIGLGFVGNAIYKSLKLKQVNVIGYDKYKENTNSFQECLNSQIMFLCLPTIYDDILKSYDKSCIIETLELLEKNNYNGLIVIKSTVEPETTKLLSDQYSNLKLIHNPEFLTARTAFDDFHNQSHIVLGLTKNINDNDIQILKTFYNHLYPNADISLCDSTESESMKIFCNCFYSVKVQFFNELFLLCQKNNSNYNNIVKLMLKNNWINPMHTQVPGPDGELSYGGYCFPKDTNALLQYMKNKKSLSKVLEATINERNLMRNDNINCK
jgi:nucleotide sugar dehydrogenase